MKPHIGKWIKRFHPQNEGDEIIHIVDEDNYFVQDEYGKKYELNAFLLTYRMFFIQNLFTKNPSLYRENIKHNLKLIITKKYFQFLIFLIQKMWSKSIATSLSGAAVLSKHKEVLKSGTVTVNKYRSTYLNPLKKYEISEMKFRHRVISLTHNNTELRSQWRRELEAALLRDQVGGDNIVDYVNAHQEVMNPIQWRRE